MAHEVEYEGGRRHRPRQHHRPREPAYDSAYSQYSHHDSDWRPARDAHFDSSPYRRSKHDIQRTDSRTSSSRQWSRSSSSLKATSTMPSSLHSRPSNLTSAPYRRGKGPTVPMYEDEPTAASRRSPSRARSTHRQRSVSVPRAPSPHSSESDSIIDDDEGGEHGESGSDLTDTSSDESDDEHEHGREHDEEEEELVGATDKNNMYTIHEDVPKPRQRSRSVRRERMEPELVADEDEINQEHQEVPAHVEELLESDPRVTHPHPHSSREAVEEEAEVPQQHSHRSRSKYPDERRSRSSHHQPYDEVPVDDRHDRSRHDNHEGHRNYSRDRDAKHRRRHSGYGKRKTRPYSPGRSEPPPPPRAFSPPRERSRRSSSQHVQRRRLSFGDSRSSAPRRSKKYYSYASDALPAETTPPRRTHTAAASHVTTPHNVSASKRAFPLGLGNVFGSSHQAPPQQEKPPRLAECFVCMGETPYGELARLKCGHRMCHACLRRFFKLSTKDAQHMPPKCCEEQIPLKHVDGLFDTRFKRSWNKKLTEFTMKNRLYCPSRHCGEPIGSQYIEKKKNGQKFAVCPSCNIKVCTICSGKYHKSRECPKDEETKRFLEQAKEEGWQRCYKCKAMVELKEGCNHMTCRCGAEFCMLCGKKWKGCECPWFNYDLVENDRLVHLDIDPPIVTEDNPFAPRFGPQESAIPYGRDYMSGPRPIRPVLSRPRSSHRSGQSSFDEELMLRRRQVQHDEEMARMFDEEMDGGYDDPDEMDRVGIGRQARLFMNEDYVHGHATAPRMRAPTSMVYVAEPPRSRRARGSSMERRLADRFAESRSTPRRRAAPPPPLGMSPPQSEMLGQMPPSPVTPTRIRRYTLEEEMYNSAPPTRRSERVIPGRLFHDYEVESAIHAPPTRRRSEPPKSSVLAGLTGPGRGMNRVFEWRTHVEPGLPEGERYAVATH